MLLNVSRGKLIAVAIARLPPELSPPKEMEAFNEAYTSDIHNPLVSPAEASDDVIARLPPELSPPKEMLLHFHRSRLAAAVSTAAIQSSSPSG